MKKLELTGQVFGRLMVISAGARMGKRDRISWICQCTCGNVLNVLGESLTSGNTTSCGCYNKEQVSKRSRLDIIGRKFGRLTVIRDVGTNERQNSLWECECECGNITTVVGGKLTSGYTKSCGCLSIELASARMEEMHKNQFGENNSSWKGGVTPEYAKTRQSDKYNTFRLTTMERDDFICQVCGDDIGGNLHVHHLKAFSRFPEIRMCVDNGITLCKTCHEEFHKLYGKLKFTSDDFYEFKRNKLELI